MNLLAEIEERGLLPIHDARVVSVTSMIAGEPVRGSWRSHPQAQEMYRLITEADEHEDVETVKLLGKKLTFVHRRLWLELYTVLTSKADWQMQDVGHVAAKTLRRIESARVIRGDAIGAERKSADLLAVRLLVFQSQTHTEQGRHERVYESWAAWRKRVKLTGRKPHVAKAWMALQTAARPYAPLNLPGP